MTQEQALILLAGLGATIAVAVRIHLMILSRKVKG